MTQEQLLGFNEHWLVQRLERVNTDILKKFVSNWQDLKNINTQKELISEVITRLKLLSNDSEFINQFKDFLRDYVLSAKVSEYILKINNKDDIIRWLNSLTQKSGEFSGRKYHFFLHKYISLNRKQLDDAETSIYYPTELALLMARSKKESYFPDGLKQIPYHKTSEFEIIFRDDMDWIEVRGDFQIVRDFMSTATVSLDNPFSETKSIFITYQKNKTPKSYLVEPVKFLHISTLKDAIKGSYLSASSPTNGSKTSRISLSFDKLIDSQEETEPSLRNLIVPTIQDADKLKIAFQYKQKEYSFGITKSGGLTFYKYTPEEVITYILQTINKIVVDNFRQKNISIPPQVTNKFSDFQSSPINAHSKVNNIINNDHRNILTKIKSYIEEKYSGNGLIGISDLAEYCDTIEGEIYVNLLALKKQGEIDII
ncbi:MAG: hypothetical protein AB4041_09025, partial [Microcystaceae cyanobacterium]